MIAVPDIWKFAPHRPPMVWVDHVISYSENGGECSIQIKGDAHYMSDHGLRPSSCLEFAAQSYGFLSICIREYLTGNPMNATPKRAFLASFNDAKFAPADVMSSIKEGDELRVHISGVRSMGPIILFQGKVLKDNTVLCSTRMKVFSE